MKAHSTLKALLLLGTLANTGTFLYSADWFGLKPSAPALNTAATLDTQDFYFYAQKQAELYRGELMTYSEMKRFGQRTKEQIRQWSMKHPERTDAAAALQYLDSLVEMPYNVKVNQKTLQSLNQLGIPKKDLEIHMTRLQSVIDSYLE